jgi:hypothetical protein
VIAALGENRVAAGDVFFGVNRVDFVFDFVAFRRDGEETDTVNRAYGWSQLRNKDAKFIPGKIDEIGQNKKRDDSEKNAANRKSVGERCGRCSGHREILHGILA